MIYYDNLEKKLNCTNFVYKVISIIKLHLILYKQDPAYFRINRNEIFNYLNVNRINIQKGKFFNKTYRKILVLVFAIFKEDQNIDYSLRFRMKEHDFLLKNFENNIEKFKKDFWVKISYNVYFDYDKKELITNRITTPNNQIIDFIKLPYDLIDSKNIHVTICGRDFYINVTQITPVSETTQLNLYKIMALRFDEGNFLIL